MPYDQIASYAQQYCPGVSPHIMTAHIAALVRDFCLKSYAWTLIVNDVQVPELPGVTIDIATDYADQLTALDARFETVLDVVGINGRLSNINYQQVRNQGFAFNRVPTDSTVTVKVVLRPSLTTAALPDDVMELHIDTLAKGLAAKILMLPNKPWTSYDHAQMYQRDYQHSCNQIRFAVVNDNNNSQAGKYNYWGGPVR